MVQDERASTHTQEADRHALHHLTTKEPKDTLIAMNRATCGDNESEISWWYNVETRWIRLRSGCACSAIRPQTHSDPWGEIIHLRHIEGPAEDEPEEEALTKPDDSQLGVARG